jgi:hypothetical protein
MMIYMLGKLLKNSSTEKVAGTAWWARRGTAEGRNGLRSVSQEWLLGSNDIGEKSPVYAAS